MHEKEIRGHGKWIILVPASCSVLPGPSLCKLSSFLSSHLPHANCFPSHERTVYYRSMEESWIYGGGWSVMRILMQHTNVGCLARFCLGGNWVDVHADFDRYVRSTYIHTQRSRILTDVYYWYWATTSRGPTYVILSPDTHAACGPAQCYPQHSAYQQHGNGERSPRLWCGSAMRKMSRCRHAMHLLRAPRNPILTQHPPRRRQASAAGALPVAPDLDPKTQQPS
jgi:hypothetical protein